LIEVTGNIKRDQQAVTKAESVTCSITSSQ